jgi:hypothetical protein
MNDRIKELIRQCEIVKYDFEGCLVEAGFDAEKFAQLVLDSLAEELMSVGTASKKRNPEWSSVPNQPETKSILPPCGPTVKQLLMLSFCINIFNAKPPCKS